MKRRFLSVLCLIALLVTFASFATAEETYNMWVKRSHKHVMMYEEPDDTSATLCHVPAGKKVRVFIDFVGSSWVNCSYNGNYGYIKANHLTGTKPKPKPTNTPKPTATPAPKPHVTPNHTPDSYISDVDALFADFTQVNYTAQVVTHNAGSTVHVRWAPTTQAPCVADYAAGVELEVLFENDEWAQVHNEQDNITGFIYKAYIEKIADAHMDEIAIEEKQIASPIHEVASYEELTAAVPGIAIAMPPADAHEESYCWIEGDPVIAQITFGLDDDYYTYRASFAATEDDVTDIDGVYLPFDEEEVLDGLFQNGFELNLRTLTTDTYAVVDWYYPSEQTQFGLFSETAGYPEMRIVTVAETLVPLDGDAESWALNEDE
ncbi:MAG: SH3 domain-containing protein [Clostridia bacterium]|nr:SH3 domain-containing protein [Clostridia bacterium]